MKFDEFTNKLKEIKESFKRRHGRDLQTIEELEQYLADRKFGVKRRHLTSLKGFNL